MRPGPKKRVETSSPAAPLAPLDEAFAGVEVPPLPAGEEEPGAARAPLWKPGRVVLRRESAHRGGKTVTVVDDFATHLPISFIENLAKRLRSVCGCGGTAKGRRIEVQGDQVSRIRAFLETEGFKVAGLR